MSSDSSYLSKVQTSGIDHIHLNVDQIDSAIALFTGLFDCTHNIPLYIDSIDGINSMNSLRVDVIAPVSEDGYFAKMMEKMGGEGVSAVSFYVDDIDDATARIEARGIKVRSKLGYPGIELQTQFSAADCFGMSIELVYLYPDAEEKIAAIKADQAKNNDGATDIPCQPGAVAAFGIDHVRLRVKNVKQAMDHISTVFECEWSLSEDGTAARSSLGMHLLQNAKGEEGIDAFAIRVNDLAAASARVAQLGLRPIEKPAYLANDNCLCLAPSNCFGVSLIMIEA